jgi:PAS domain S-box-containing protein/putative nucleotidyltransferase with HDIG domain
MSKTHQRLPTKRLSRGRFHAIFNSALDGIFICDVDRGKFIDVNETGCAMSGYDRRELVGCDIGKLSTGVPPFTQEAAFPWFKKAQVAPQLFEWHCKAKDGHLFWVEISLCCVSTGSGSVGLAFLKDTTARRETAKELRLSEDQNKAFATKLETVFMQTVAAVTTLIEKRDPYTAGHERRVAEIAVAIGAELGFNAHRQQGLRVAGYLHDVGKINVPAEILSKPGKLSAAEVAIIREHSQTGYDVLKEVEFPWPVAQVALQHHERIDGSGYPQGLKGDEIILEARIMAVADVVESMASHRPYRAALGIANALAEIERGRGTAFDADAADACLRLFRENRYQITSMSSRGLTAILPLDVVSSPTSHVASKAA